MPADDHNLPRVTFTDPELGATGLTAHQAARGGLQVRIGISPTCASTRGWIPGPGNEGFIKLVEDVDRNVLVGATVMGPKGGEVMAMLALAVEAEVPLSALRTMIYSYPSFPRGVEGALGSLAEARQPVPV